MTLGSRDRLFWGSYSKHAQDLGTSARSFKMVTPPSVSAVSSETNLAGRLPPSRNLPVIFLYFGQVGISKVVLCNFSRIVTRSGNEDQHTLGRPNGAGTRPELGLGNSSNRTPA